MSEMRLWSVTTLLRLALGEGPGLVNWKVGCAADVAVKRRAWIGRMIDEDGEDAAVTYVREAHRRESSKSAGRGTALHKVAEALALGQDLPVVDAHVLPFVEQFAGWVQRHQPEFLMTEAPVYNPEVGYAGTLDGIMRLADRPLLYDIKSTKHGPHSGKARPPFPEVALQLCAYSRATQVGVLSEQRYSGGKRYYIYDPDAHHEPLPEVAGGLCIVVSPEDCFAVPVRITEDVWQTWLAVLRCAAYRVASGHDLFGPVLVDPEPVIA